METLSHKSVNLLGPSGEYGPFSVPSRLLSLVSPKELRVSVVFSYLYQCCSPLVSQVIKDWLYPKLEKQVPF